MECINKLKRKNAFELIPVYSVSADSSSLCDLRWCVLNGCLRRDTFVARGFSVVVGGFSKSSNCLSVNWPLYQSALEKRENSIIVSLCNGNAFHLYFMNIYFVPFRNFSCPIASFGNIVKGLAQFAAISSRLLTIDAHIKELAIFWISVSWMRGSCSFIDFRTCELEQFCARETRKKMRDIKGCNSSECLPFGMWRAICRDLPSDEHPILCASSGQVQMPVL